MAKGYEIEYGGYVKDRKTGKEDLLFTTFMSAFLCKQRTIEEAKSWNEQGASYDVKSITVRYRKLETAINPWRDSEDQAKLDSAIIRKEDCWYTESWTDDDLERILGDINIEPTREYIDMARNVVTADTFMRSFSDLSDRNVWIENALDDFFYSKPVMIKRIVEYIVETGTQNTSNGNWTVCTDDLQDKFDVSYDWLLENRKLIKDSIDGRDEVLSATWDSFDDTDKWNGFDCNFCGDCCSNYEE